MSSSSERTVDQTMYLMHNMISERNFSGAKKLGLGVYKKAKNTNNSIILSDKKFLRLLCFVVIASHSSHLEVDYYRLVFGSRSNDFDDYEIIIKAAIWMTNTGYPEEADDLLLTAIDSYGGKNPNILAILLTCRGVAKYYCKQARESVDIFDEANKIWVHSPNNVDIEWRQANRFYSLKALVASNYRRFDVLEQQDKVLSNESDNALRLRTKIICFAKIFNKIDDAFCAIKVPTTSCLS